MAWCGNNQADGKTMKEIASCYSLQYGKCQNITQNIALSQYSKTFDARVAKSVGYLNKHEVFVMVGRILSPLTYISRTDKT